MRLAPPGQRDPCRESCRFLHPVRGITDNSSMSKQKQQYLQYLKSEHWQTLRRAAFERDGYKCIRCRSPRRIGGHHKRYRADLNSCTVDDIETLCWRCHRGWHAEKKRLRREARAARKARHASQYLAYLILNFGYTR